MNAPDERDVDREKLARLLQVRLLVLDKQVGQMRDWVQPDQKQIDGNLGAITELLRLARYLGIELNWSARWPQLPSDYPLDATARRSA